MINYIAARRHVNGIIKPYCTKGQIVHVTNRIMTRLRDRRILNRDVVDLVVAVAPLPFNPEYKHDSMVELDSGLRVYYAVIFKRN